MHISFLFSLCSKNLGCNIRKLTKTCQPDTILVTKITDAHKK